MRSASMTPPVCIGVHWLKSERTGAEHYKLYIVSHPHLCGCVTETSDCRADTVVVHMLKKNGKSRMYCDSVTCDGVPIPHWCHRTGITTNNVDAYLKDAMWTDATLGRMVGRMMSRANAQ